MAPDNWRELYENRDSLFNLAKPEFCGKVCINDMFPASHTANLALVKWSILKKLLKFWYENGDKVLIFSHSVRLLKMLQLLLGNTSYNISFLSGSMANEDRQKTVYYFNSDPSQFVFLISTRAGGK
jgi:SNF2 family DNA or RNA helicase